MINKQFIVMQVKVGLGVEDLLCISEVKEKFLE